MTAPCKHCNRPESGHDMRTPDEQAQAFGNGAYLKSSDRYIASASWKAGYLFALARQGVGEHHAFEAKVPQGCVCSHLWGNSQITPVCRAYLHERGCEDCERCMHDKECHRTEAEKC